MGSVRQISEKKIRANRRNACKSTDPKTAAGKDASRLNAVTHGLLAQTVVITTGDYKENAQAFGQLLKGLREQFAPVSVAEGLEVEEIARCYWRKMRAGRYEHGAIQTRTGGLREREALSREQRFEHALRSGENLERSSRGIAYLIDGLQEIKQEVLAGTRYRESVEWLEQHFSDEFAPHNETQAREQTAAGPAGSEDDGRQLVATIDKQLRRLASLQEKVAAIEILNLESKILGAALPASPAVDKLARYEASNDRLLDRAIKRLERWRAWRREPRGAPAAQ